MKMKSFSSSAINKSGKKFAPKAPVRRAAPAPPRRPSVASQPSASQTPQPATETATPEPSQAAPIVEPPAPVETAIPEPSATQTASVVKPSSSATAIPIPRSTRKPSISAATPALSNERPTPSQPPQSAQPSQPSQSSQPSQPSPPPPSTSHADPTPLPSTDTADKQIRNDALVNEPERLDSPYVREGPQAPKSRSVSVSETSTEIRPSKRVKITPEVRPTTTEPQPSIETPQLITPPATQTPAAESTTESQDTSEPPVTTNASQKTTKSRKRKAPKDGSTTIKTRERKPRARKQREPTPEGSEQVEIAPGVIKMSELCKDLRTGKKSKREAELRKLEQAEQERKQAAQEEGATEEPPAVKPNENASEPPAGENGADQSQSGPVMRIVNGEIVLDTSSLQVDRHAAAARSYGDLEDVVENSFTRKINQSTYGKRTKTESWDEDLTDLFYKGLRMFGTDFMMISKLFPGRSRRQIKLKFNKEERRDPGRIKDTLLGPRETFDIHTYSEMTNTVFDDPKVVQQELDEEKKRIEEQHAKDKQAQEELLHNPDGAADGADPDKPNTAPTKGKRNNKKQAKDIGGAQEEILGTIDDFP
ncbi:transcription factor TFIIIB subunit BDP1 [Aspergillus affinis]|uniref:transcription factor TFIIIB subunit BDP1 n=1 Tax=Aspergillus affinis TaxID=1070780 RepID=UPI0022FDF791|nr:transcription factor IIIB [Aspergillus affinis]KAI9036063.1 transcription factor IIIB [Aspergillus affinis]